jgi:signal transduction histidine kinase
MPAMPISAPTQNPSVEVTAPGEDLPFDDGSFDTVVSTLVLRTVSGPRRAVADHGGRSLNASADRAVAEERRRIARELHDVVGHNLSLMVIVAQALGTGAAGEARPLADSIASLGREAMAELATTLDQLRPSAETAGGPSLAALPKLVDHARWAGVGAELQVEGAPRPVPDAIDLSGYRIVQEALTNVIRHAGARRAAVRVHYGTDAIGLEIADDGVGPGPESPPIGQGLLGMRERAALFGGTLTYGARDGGGFRVAAVLPAKRQGRSVIPAERLAGFIP